MQPGQIFSDVTGVTGCFGSYATHPAGGDQVSK